MGKVKLTVIDSSCRCGYCRTGDEYLVGDICPPVCHELWDRAYPMVYALLNGADLDYGAGRAKAFDVKCPDEGRVWLHGEIVEQSGALIGIEMLTADNFGPTSLDGFVRTQKVTQVYRMIDGEYRLKEQPFTDEWTAERKREKAAEILSGKYIAYGAFDGGRIIGFIMLDKMLNNGRMIADSFHVSQECRHQGVGRKLFACAMDEGRRRGASQLYFSACSSKETIGFYFAMGCRLADPVIRELAEKEPFDLQLVCDINECASESIKM